MDCKQLLKILGLLEKYFFLVILLKIEYSAGIRKLDNFVVWSLSSKTPLQTTHLRISQKHSLTDMAAVVKRDCNWLKK